MIHSIAVLLWRIVCWLELTVFTLVLYTLSWLPGALVPFYYTLFRFWCRTFVRALGVDLKLHQKNTRPLPSQYILIANHPSAFEDIGIPALFPVHSLAKIEVRDWWLVGRISMAAGSLYVHRESPESRNAAGVQIEEELQKGKNIALYPEGGCKGRRIFESFRYGAFEISLQTGIPILPVFLHYESQDDFEWREPQTLLHKIWHMLTTQNKRANYYVYDAFDPEQFADKAAYAEYAHNKYLEWQARYLD
ncbi:MAG: 1-acyl-sn-glycerol-3-phosphate acyltransferase [Gammaproteobacteria bacterium]|nr:MAG: 1-acyl-sn-glycerol-3-phosphate acyltransferase [Gammaproteobacteria bacterium]